MLVKLDTIATTQSNNRAVLDDGLSIAFNSISYYSSAQSHACLRGYAYANSAAIITQPFIAIAQRCHRTCSIKIIIGQGHCGIIINSIGSHIACQANAGGTSAHSSIQANSYIQNFIGRISFSNYLLSLDNAIFNFRSSVRIGAHFRHSRIPGDLNAIANANGQGIGTASDIASASSLHLYRRRLSSTILVNFYIIHTRNGIHVIAGYGNTALSCNTKFLVADAHGTAQSQAQEISFIGGFSLQRCIICSSNDSIGQASLNALFIHSAVADIIISHSAANRGHGVAARSNAHRACHTFLHRGILGRYGDSFSIANSILLRPVFFYNSFRIILTAIFRISALGCSITQGNTRAYGNSPGLRLIFSCKSKIGLSSVNSIQSYALCISASGIVHIIFSPG